MIGLTGTVVGNTVQLYATNATVGDLNQTYVFGINDVLADTTRRAQATGEAFTTLYTAAADTNVRGVAFAPTPACYCRGTLIRTVAGDVPVEALAVGDVLVTASGGAEPVRWIGQRAYAGRFLAGRDGLLPILFRAGSLGGGLPLRDLRVSPCHAMFLDGVLIPAAALVNGTTVVQDRGCRLVEYFHVELAAHDVILAEGAASESFVDDDSRWIFHNAAEYAGPETGEAVYCAPRVESGYALEAVRQRLGAIRLAA